MSGRKLFYRYGSLGPCVVLDQKRYSNEVTSLSNTQCFWGNFTVAHLKKDVQSMELTGFFFASNVNVLHIRKVVK